MNPGFTEILRERRPVLVNIITNVESVLDYLLSSKTITEEHLQVIQAETTRSNRIRKLLEILPRRGSRAFGDFYRAIHSTKETGALEILDKELTNRNLQLPFEYHKKESAKEENEDSKLLNTEKADKH